MSDGLVSAVRSQSSSANWIGLLAYGRLINLLTV